MKSFTHVSFYKFVEIDDPAKLQSQLKVRLQELELKGTVLIATEGINVMLAGTEASIATLIAEFKMDSRFKDALLKLNKSETQPFKKLLVKVKSEILTFKEDSIKPHLKTGHYVKPQDLREWLNAGDDIVLVDSRNHFEVELGTFQDAIDPEIKSFMEFKNASLEKLTSYKDKKIITFCTGGIRCEKASAYLMEHGFKNVWQLEGGILQYLKETDGAFWQGECFVFDERISVNKNLEEKKLNFLEEKKAN